MNLLSTLRKVSLLMGKSSLAPKRRIWFSGILRKKDYKPYGTIIAITIDSRLRPLNKNWFERGIMSELKKVSIGIAAAAIFAIGLIVTVPAQSEVQASDPAAFYKAKCVICHGQKAEKKFDTALTDDQLVEVVMKGKKPEKPPNMPAYGEKGVTAEQAKGLVDYMKQLKAAQ